MADNLISQVLKTTGWGFELDTLLGSSRKRGRELKKKRKERKERLVLSSGLSIFFFRCLLGMCIQFKSVERNRVSNKVPTRLKISHNFCLGPRK